MWMLVILLLVNTLGVACLYEALRTHKKGAQAPLFFIGSLLIMFGMVMTHATIKNL
jgi:hypothetical protein